MVVAPPPARPPRFHRPRADPHPMPPTRKSHCLLGPPCPRPLCCRSARPACPPPQWGHRDGRWRGWGRPPPAGLASDDGLHSADCRYAGRDTSGATPPRHSDRLRWDRGGALLRGSSTAGRQAMVWGRPRRRCHAAAMQAPEGPPPSRWRRVERGPSTATAAAVPLPPHRRDQRWATMPSTPHGPPPPLWWWGGEGGVLLRRPRVASAREAVGR